MYVALSMPKQRRVIRHDAIQHAYNIRCCKRACSATQCHCSESCGTSLMRARVGIARVWELKCTRVCSKVGPTYSVLSVVSGCALFISSPGAPTKRTSLKIDAAVHETVNQARVRLQVTRALHMVAPHQPRSLAPVGASSSSRRSTSVQNRTRRLRTCSRCATNSVCSPWICASTCAKASEIGVSAVGTGGRNPDAAAPILAWPAASWIALATHWLVKRPPGSLVAMAGCRHYAGTPW